MKTLAMLALLAAALSLQGCAWLLGQQTPSAYQQSGSGSQPAGLFCQPLVGGFQNCTAY
jgi:hypothetical protein